MDHRVLQILEAKWLIERNTVLSYAPLFISFLNGSLRGEKLAWEWEEEIYKVEQSELKKHARAISMDEDPLNPVDKWDLTDPTVPENSIALIDIEGIMYSWKTQMIENWTKQAIDNPNINSILYLVNTPGGMVFYTDITSKTIKESPKPTVACILNMAASAGMWLVSGMDYRICTSPLDRVGSIGVMTSFTSMKGLMEEKLGIIMKDFYATDSPRKNEISRALIADINDDKLLIADLDYVNAIFHSAIEANLGIKKADKPDIFTGALFNAPDAITNGLIHEMNTMDYALEYAYKLGLANKITNLSNQFNINR